MRTYATAVLLTALMGLCLWLLHPASAEAAPSFDPPPGWDEGSAADPDARDRARAWAAAWSADVRQVMSPRADDDFAETLAVLDVAAPIPAEALAELEAGRTWLEPRISAALGTTASLEPDALELRPRPEPGVAVLVGRVQQSDRIAWIALAPRGARHLAIVLLVPAAEEILYANVFDDVVERLDDLRPPIAPFPHAPLRWGALAAWVLVGAALGVGWTRRCLPRPGARVAGRQVALALLGAALVVLVLVGVALDGAVIELELELALASSTPWTLAFEIAMGGAVAAALVLGATELWARRLQPVASAPEGGTFARTGAMPRRGGVAPELVDPVTDELPEGIAPAVTGDTHVGPAPAITGDTQIGPAPAITGDTQIGPAPAVTGHTRIGPPPRPLSAAEVEAGPPVREVISGDIEVQTQVRRIPEPDTVETVPPAPSGVARVDPDEDTNPRAPSEPPASLVDAHDEPAGRSRPTIEIDWS